MDHRRKFRSQTPDPTMWTDGKDGKAEAGRVREEKVSKRRSHKKEDQRRKKKEVEKHCVFPMFCVSGGSKSRLAKAAGAEASDRIRNQKLHAAVARSVFPSQNIILAIPWVGSTWSIL